MSEPKKLVFVGLTYDQVCRAVEKIDARQAIIDERNELRMQVDRQQAVIRELLEAIKGSGVATVRTFEQERADVVAWLRLLSNMPDCEGRDGVHRMYIDINRIERGEHVGSREKVSP